MSTESSKNFSPLATATWNAALASAARIVAQCRSQCPSDFDPQNGTEVKAPDARNLGTETRDTLQAQVDLAPAQFAAEAKYQPQMADVQRGILSTSLTGNEKAPGLLDMLEQQINPAMSRMSSQSNLQQRTDDIDAVTRLGPQALAAWKAANPEQAGLMSELNTQALGDLRLGATLDPSLRREVQQSSRGAQAARGMGYGNNDAANEALWTGMRAEQLRGTRRGFATQVAGLNQATSADPYSMILGRSSNPAAAAGLLGAGQQQSQLGGNRLFNPESSYAQDLNNTNYNAQAAANISSANNKSALIGAGISAAGSAASAM